MAYNKINYYKRIIKIQDITQEQYHCFGLSYKEIFHKFIENQFNISKRTFHTYLGVPAKRELRKFEEQKNKSKQLNFNF
ncbi:MAG: hypothetical protein ACTTJM_03185 [Bergeyella cardium]|nr:MAG TPA: hypothetical protein [Caudoviricetes sp.]